MGPGRPIEVRPINMGLPSGLLWAPVNVDYEQPNGFARTMYQYECSFASWGNTDAHNANGVSFSPWSFSEENYNSSPGASIEYPNQFDELHDVARASCGNPWRVPTLQEFNELLANIDFIDKNGTIITGTNKTIMINGIYGVLMQSKTNKNKLFFPLSGYGNGTIISNLASWGAYMLNTLSNNQSPYRIQISVSGVSTSASQPRYRGFAIRPVCDP